MKPSKGRFLDLLCLFFCLSTTHFCTTVWAQTTEIKWDADSLAAETPSGAACASLRNAEFDTTEKSEGTASMKFTSPTGDVQGDMGCIDLSVVGDLNLTWDSGKWLCQHFDMKIDSSFDWFVNADKMKMQRMKNTGNGDRWTMYLKDGGVTISECSNCDDCTGGDNCSNMNYSMVPGGANPVTNWQSYTIGIKMQTGAGNDDGEIKLWVDGTLEDSLTDETYCSDCTATMRDGWGVFGMHPFPQSPDGIIWFDDFLMTSGVNECVPRGGPKRPAPPTNLQEISP